MRARLPLNNLNTFATAAELLSFQEAAVRLSVSPSAVSHQIRNLEKQLNYKLFERQDKQVELTPRGQHLFSRIKDSINSLHKASREALEVDGDNNLTLSVAPIFATRWLLPRLKDFAATHPGINTSVIATTDIVDFGTDPIDAAIRLGNGKWSGLKSEKLFPKQIVAVCHPMLLKGKKKKFSTAELLTQSLVHTSSMDGLWKEWFASAGVSLKENLAGLQLQNSAQVLQAVQMGDSVGLVDLAFIDKELKEGSLVLASGHILSGDDGYFLAYPESSDKPKIIEAFRQWLFTHLSD